MPAIRSALLSCLLITGCVSTDAVLITPQGGQQASCLQFYQDLDVAVFANDAEDTGEMRIPGFPYLRGNRFFASFAGASMSDSAYAQWLEQMRQLDENARLAEFAARRGRRYNFPLAGGFVVSAKAQRMRPRTGRFGFF
ncbi:hypothetical protein [Methylotuvimicrobium sp.]|uniref:hypothetical protein n=1 Tax=Methylotuvimicrobium sp. TaxID=2822413 RepID=UPI003D65F83F